MAVVAGATSGNRVIALINGGQEVDIILANLNAPLMDGVRLTTRLKRMRGNVKVIFLSDLDNGKHIERALRAGARGCLPKNVSVDELVFAIKKVHAGGRYICSDFSLRLLEDLMRGSAPSKNLKPICLTRRELEVLKNVAAGYTNMQIAERLSLSKRTVEVHRRKILFKTGTKNTAMLIRFAYINKYIPLVEVDEQ